MRKTNKRKQLAEYKYLNNSTGPVFGNAGVRYKKPVLFVGEAPMPGSPPLTAFYGQSGWRLSSLIGVPLRDVGYGINLLQRPQPLTAGGSSFDRTAAKAAADMLKLSMPLWRHGTVVVLVGKRVASAFGHGGARYFELRLSETPDGRCGPAVFVIPHPSGRCRWWNRPANRRTAEAWFARFKKFLSNGALLP